MNRLFRGASRAALILALSMPAAAIAGTISGTVSDGTGTRALQSTQLTIVELGRIAEAQDVANMVAFLAGEDASFITGQAYKIGRAHV